MTHRIGTTLASSSHPSHDVIRSSRTSALLLAICGVLSGCVPAPDHPDGGDEPTDGAAFAANAHVNLPHESLEGGGLTVNSFVLRIGSLRLVSDRGEAFDPVRTDVGTVDLASATTVEFTSIPPASYSAAVITLEGVDPVLRIEIDDAELGALVRVSSGARVEWMARCSSGVPIGVGEMLDVGIDVELQAAWDDLRAATLPDAVDGVITLDDETAPDVVVDLVRALGEAIRAECDRNDAM